MNSFNDKHKRRLDGLDSYERKASKKEEYKNENSERVIDTEAKKEDSINSIREININKNFRNEDLRFKEIPLTKRKMKFWKKILITTGLLAIIVAMSTYLFYSASFKVTQLEKDVTFSNNIFKANILNTKVGEEIPFKIIDLDYSLSDDLKSELVEDVKKKAVGKIKIINNTSKVQKLRKETRFEVNGKIFKTYKSVTVPAKSSLIREAFADNAGVEYNLKKGLKMTIPGFKEVKDTNSYKNIIGEIAENFEGGFVGKKDIPDKNDYEKKKTQLEDDIKTSVLIRVKKELPEDYILNTDGVFSKITFKTETKNEKLKLIANAKVKAIIFNKDDLLSVASGLTKKRIKDYKITSTAFLKFKTLEKDSLSSDNLKSFNFELNGKIRYVKKFDQNKFLDLVHGKKVSDLKPIYEENFSDFEINTSVFPFWMNIIPEEKEKITVKFEE